ncbi:MAG: class I SAM-dependent methyltransferase [Phascolarctobacterium sp.]|nr:class I SAM-dependent methyltransferase [Phascolarctobacterium sp.]
MHLDERLQAVAAFVPKNCILADIGTDHAYLPVWLLEKGAISRAIAGDIAAGPCQAARTTVAMHGMAERVEVRQGSGLAVVRAGEVDCVAICGMGGSTIISILEADFAVARSVQRLVLQPMAGAASLRRWLVEHGWELVQESLVDDEPHFYQIICAKPVEASAATEGSSVGEASAATEGSSVDVGSAATEGSSVSVPAASVYSPAELVIGPTLLRDGHPLLAKHISREIAGCEELLANMGRSEKARASAKYAEVQELLSELKGIGVI